jgi:CheY-like chemotaxis protein
MHTDVKRLQQIIKNLLSNAFKFTHQGKVVFSASIAHDGWSPDNEELNRAGQVLAFAVSDTGIGISRDKQQIIFEAFQQADGSTSRKYGGTGLGLAISRELSRLLGGEIRLVSAPGKGSKFTLYLPQTYNPARAPRHPRLPGSEADKAALLRLRSEEAAREIEMLEAPALDEPDDDAPNPAADDRDAIGPDDRVLLIVENDLAFARLLLEAARERGFKGLVSPTGATALTMTREAHPSALTLDIHLPDMEGWRVLDRLKTSADTRHIPICVVSTDDARERALEAGAIGFLTKPLHSKDLVDAALAELHRFVESSQRKLLVVMPHTELREAFLGTLEHDVEVRVIESPEAAREAMHDVHCVVVDARVPGIGPEDVLDVMEQRDGAMQLPVVLYRGGGDGDAGSGGVWQRRHAGFALFEANTLEGLLAHTAFCLHRSPVSMSEAERAAVDVTHGGRHALIGKKALIVDDDMRNIFALATVLADEGMVIVSAHNGREAIRLVEADPLIDIVLMDIMMPDMDGMETMRQIRARPQGRDLPMIAVTAKAMKGDRQKCIEAGAWDYISKPVDPTHLLAVLRGWLCL